jgi:cysteine desulfurase / selenocysteine lyase
MFEDIRKEFPILKSSFFGKKLVYLDSAATTQKPQRVIDRLVQYYTKENSNIHRGLYNLSIEATKLWEEAHQVVADFIVADSYKEIIFTRNTTEGLNFLVNIVGNEFLSDGDIVVISDMEHHSNIVPWMILQKKIRFELRYIPLKEDFSLDLDWLNDLIKKEGKRVKIVSVVHISNVLGVRNDVKEIFNIAKKVEAFTILDAAQSIARCEINVNDIGCDSLIFSGHKMYGPTGSGAIYCKEDYLKKFVPWMGGGEMISTVTKEGFKYNNLPWKFEAGTPDIGGGIVLGTTVKWLRDTVQNVGGWGNVISHEQELVSEFLKQFEGLEWFRHFGPCDISRKYGSVAFIVEGFAFRGCKDVNSKVKKESGDKIMKFLNSRGIAFRSGYHCAEPLHDNYGTGPTLRFSFGIYNNLEDVKYCTKVIKEAVLRGLT